MKLLFWVALFAILSTHSAAQVYDFGDIPDEHLQMEVYDKDSSASAIVLFAIGESELNYTTVYKVDFDHHERIKILTAEGLDQADITISFRHENPQQRILGLKAHAYHIDEFGRTVTTQLDKDDIYVEKVSDNYSEMKFSIPGVKKGSVIEYSFKKSSNYFLDFPDWFFQREIPVLWSEYKTRIPDYFKFLTLTRGYHYYHTQESKPYNDNRMGMTALGTEYLYVMTDIPAVTDEPYMNAREDYVAHVRFVLNSIEIPGRRTNQVLENWPDIIKDINGSRNFGKRLKNSKELEQILEEIDSNEFANGLEKVKAIYDTVSNQIEWNNRVGLYLREGLDHYIREGSGHGSAINMILIQLLREAGFESYPVLVNTRSNGEVIGMFPFTSQFNHVIAYVAVEGEYYLLDAKNEYRPYNILPVNLLGTVGLMVYENDQVWLPIDQRVKNSSFKNITISLDQDSIRGEIKTQLKGHYAVDMNVMHDEEDFSSSLTEKYLGTNSNYSIKNLSVENNDVLSEFEMTFDLEQDGLGDYSVYYFNPMVMDRLGSNPFKLNERTYPIDYDYPFDESIVMTINIPEGWVVDELPQPVLYRLPGRAGEFRRIIRAEGNQISMSYRYKIDKIRFMPEEYEILKGMYDQMVTSLAENIVLKKAS